MAVRRPPAAVCLTHQRQRAVEATEAPKIATTADSPSSANRNVISLLTSSDVVTETIYVASSPFECPRTHRDGVSPCGTSSGLGGTSLCALSGYRLLCASLASFRNRFAWDRGLQRPTDQRPGCHREVAELTSHFVGSHRTAPSRLKRMTLLTNTEEARAGRIRSGREPGQTMRSHRRGRRPAGRAGARRGSRPTQASAARLHS